MPHGGTEKPSRTLRVNEFWGENAADRGVKAVGGFGEYGRLAGRALGVFRMTPGALDGLQALVGAPPSRRSM